MLSLNILTPSLLAMIASHLLIVTSAPANGGLHNLELRKSLDHNLRCNHILPSSADWPPNAPSRENYQTLVDMCGMIPNRETVGCLCDVPYTRVGCRRAIANQPLYRAFNHYCANHCICDNAGKGSGDHILAVSGPPNPPPSPFDSPVNPGSVSGPNPFRDIAEAPTS